MLCRRIYCWRQRFSILNTFYSVTCASVGTWRKVGWPRFPSLNAFISAQSCFSWVWLKLPWRCLNKSDQRDWGKEWSILLWWEWVCVCPRSSRDCCDSGGRAANPVQKKSNSHKMQELLCEQLSLNLLHMTVITSYQNMTDFCLWFQVDAFLTGGNIFHCTLLLHLYCETVFFLILIVNLSF